MNIHQNAGSASVSTDSTRFHLDHAGRRQGRELPPFAPDPRFLAVVERVFSEQRHDDHGSTNPYALQPDTLALLSELLAVAAPRSIVEFGSGESTALFASWAAEHGTSVLSIEHDRRWINDVSRRLDARQRAAIRIAHAPLRPIRVGFRQFLTYRSLSDFVGEVERADLLLLDGPHISGREVVLYFALRHCHPGAVIVVDDLRHYAVFDMLADLPVALARGFSATTIDANSHGLLLLKCIAKSGQLPMPMGNVKSILRSYWRCLRDFSQHGTGD